MTLRTTFIVGFPGESEQDVDELVSFVRDTGFDHVGVFTYSHEEGTRAYAMTDDVPARVKTRRRARVMQAQQDVVAARREAQIGSVVRVMIDGLSPESDLVLTGRLEGQAPDIDSVVILSECDPSTFVPGTVVEARIVGSSDYDLVAAPLPVTA